MQRFIPIGRLGKTYGFQGFVKVQSYGDSPLTLLEYTPIYWQQNQQWQTCPIESREQRGQQVLFKLTGFDSLEDAKILANRELAITHEQLPQLERGEYYWADLLSLQVINQQSIELGRVDHLFDTGPHDVMVVKAQHEYLIPFVQPQYVQKVDLQQGIIQVDWDAEFIATDT